MMIYKIEVNGLIKSRPALAIILILIMILAPGCSSQKSAEKKPADTAGQKPKAPQELKTISSDLDKLISGLDQKYKSQNMPSINQNIPLIPQKQGQNGQSQNGQTTTTQSSSGQSQGGQTQSEQSQNGQSQSKQSTTGQSQSDQSQGDQTQTGQSQTKKAQNGQSETGQSQSAQSQTKQTQTGQTQGTQSQKTSSDWQSEFSTLKDIHTSWNSLMPEAVQAGMSVEARSQFDKALEDLTQQISKQKLEESLAASLQVYKNFADLTKLFTSPVPAEFYQLKYEIMAAIFEASRNNWTAAAEHAPKFKESWVYLSAQAKDADPKIVSRTEFAVLDLEKAIQSKQMELVIIKGQIAMTNLKNLETKLSSQSSNQSQGSGSSNSKQ